MNPLGNAENGINSDTPATTIGSTAAGARNVISANGDNGIELELDATGATVAGNIIGLDVTGTTGMSPTGSLLGNVSNGVLSIAISTSGSPTMISTNTISANGGNGITLGSSATRVILINNIIGLDVSGAMDTSPGGSSLGNTGSGVDSAAQNTQISGNTIAGNTGNGIFLASAASNTQIQGNMIGTDQTGMIPLGNAGDGVVGSGTNTLIGGTSAADRNVIAANSGDAIAIGTKSTIHLNNLVEGNDIGTDASGNATNPAFGNGGDGVRSSGVGNTIGGTAPVPATSL